MIIRLASLLGLLAVITVSDAEVFTSLADLLNVINAETMMLNAIKAYIRGEEAKLEYIKKRIYKIEPLNQVAVSNPSQYIGHPVNDFSVAKRFLWEWQEIENVVVLDQSKSAYLADINQHRSTMPEKDDMTGAAVAILRLQYTYNLNTSNIANGRIEGAWMTPTLSAHECFEMGKTAYETKDFYHAILWLKEALTRLPDVSAAINRISILDFLSSSLYQHGNMNEAMLYLNELLAADPTNRGFLNKKISFEREPRSVTENGENNIYGLHRPKEQSAFEGLCRGDKNVVRTPPNLKCRYRHYRHPLLMIQPAKEEVIFDRPRLVMFREMLSVEEMRIVKEMAIPILNRATVRAKGGGGYVYSQDRTSKSAWLDRNHPVVRRIRERVLAYTGLNVNTAEDLQVVNYGIGGHYNPHYDFLIGKDNFGLGTGNRIATLLFYMSDVEAGGCTVFPDVRARVEPEGGSAVFWYNLHPSGQGNMDTKHAACPVLAGSKWVSNVWFHEYGNEFLHKCDLDVNKY